MDPASALGVIATIQQLIFFIGKTILYLNDVKDAPKVRETIALEANSIQALLMRLQYRLDSLQGLQPPWMAAVESLGEKHGPLEQFQATMESLAQSVKEDTGVKKLGKRLTWSLNREKIKDILSKIERFKSLVNIALQEDHLQLSLALKEETIAINETVSVMINNQQNHEQRNAIAWLSPLNFSAKQADVLSSRHENTGTWFLQLPRFQQWLTDPPNLLWCYGIPGAGKTVISSIAIDYIQKTVHKSNTAVLGIYCNYKDQENQTAVSLIASLLKQLFQIKGRVSEEFIKFYNVNLDKQTRPTLNEISHFLSLEVQTFSKTFVIIDALDECFDGDDTRKGFLHKIKTLQPFINTMITSRPLPSIERDIQPDSQIEILARKEDIESYILGRIHVEQRLTKIVGSDEMLRRALIDTIATKIKGMFLIARLHVDSLAKRQNKRDLRVALERLPKELDDVYDETMHRIDMQNSDDTVLARRVLFWISCVERPLQMNELQHALAVEADSTDFDDEGLTDEDTILSVCCGLVVIDDESQDTRLIHYTTQDYLEGRYKDQLLEAQLGIAQTCLTYLLYTPFSTSLDVVYGMSEIPAAKIKAACTRYPFYRYAANYWDSHARDKVEHKIKKLILKFFDAKYNVAFSEGDFRSKGYDPVTAAWRNRQIEEEYPTLLLAARYGILEVAQTLLDQGVDVNIADKWGVTALCEAVFSGQIRLVDYLIASKAKVETTLGHEYPRELLERWAGQFSRWVEWNTSLTPLALAVRYNRVEIARTLLSHGADLNVVKSKQGGDTLLHQTSLHDTTDMTRVLLEFGAQINATSIKGMTPLHEAVYNKYGCGHHHQQLLLAHGADIQAAATGHRSYTGQLYGSTALHLASYYGNENSVCELIKNGAIVDSRDTRGRTPLMCRASSDNSACTLLLLKHGASVHARDNNGDTALHYAVSGMSEDRADNSYLYLSTPETVAKTMTTSMNALLDHSADIEVKNKQGHTPLSLAIMIKEPIFVKTLISRGANVHAIASNVLRVSGKVQSYEWAEGSFWGNYQYSLEQEKNRVEVVKVLEEALGKTISDSTALISVPKPSDLESLSSSSTGA